MALVKCDECGHQVSERAAACPRCGAPRQQRQAMLVAFGLALALAAGLLLLMWR